MDDIIKMGRTKLLKNSGGRSPLTEGRTALLAAFWAELALEPDEIVTLDKSSKSQLPIPISTSSITLGNSLNTSASSLSAENMPTVPLLNPSASNTRTANNLKQNRKKKKLTTKPKPDIEIQMTPHKPKKK
ncbi:hypothetical protein TNCV_3427641 [Trichonephila clavipes]|nr:hypothetical protein TNCV_3427641 [Trichonephila clavipes]